MTASEEPRLKALPAQPNPYTDSSPLVVRDHPLRDNRGPVLAGAIVAAAPVIWLVVRAVTGAEPLLPGELVLALAIGVPLGALMALFPLLLGSGAQVTVGDTRLTRKVSARRGPTKSVALNDIRSGIYASQVRYRRDVGKELVLFLPESEVLWIADGIAADDVERIAQALSSYGIKEYAEPIGNQQLQALIRKARRG